jgi:glycerol uptake facilitator-like aquaporin
MLAHLLSEFLGTTLLIGTIAKVGKTIWIIAAFIVAKTLTGPISGGYLNPAITLWAYSVGKVTANQALQHVIGQLAAALTVVYFV